MNSERAEELKERAERIRVRGPPKIKLVLDLTAEKGSSVWVTVLLLREINSTMIKQEFRNADKLR